MKSIIYAALIIFVSQASVADVLTCKVVNEVAAGLLGNNPRYASSYDDMENKNFKIYLEYHDDRVVWINADTDDGDNIIGLMLDNSFELAKIRFEDNYLQISNHLGGYYLSDKTIRLVEFNGITQLYLHSYEKNKWHGFSVISRPIGGKKIGIQAVGMACIGELDRKKIFEHLR